MKNEPGMTLIVKTITRFTVGLILVYGIYIVLHGHLGPGGGFAGGVIIALSFIHLMLAFGKDEVLEKLGEKRNLILASSGALLFLLILTMGSLGKHHILKDAGSFNIFAAIAILLSDLSSALLVGAGLFLIFTVLILLTGDQK